MGIWVEDVLALMPEKQEVTVVYGEFSIKAEAEALRHMLTGAILRSTVTMVRRSNKAFDISIEVTAQKEGVLGE